MTRFFLPPDLALAALVPPTLVSTAQAQQPAAPELTIQQKTALRCSVAFALVAERRIVGHRRIAPRLPLGERGREFFVRSSAQIMDETGMSREAVAELLAAEVAGLQEPETLASVMPPCLLLLDASGL